MIKGQQTYKLKQITSNENKPYKKRLSKMSPIKKQHRMQQRKICRMPLGVEADTLPLCLVNRMKLNSFHL